MVSTGLQGLPQDYRDIPGLHRFNRITWVICVCTDVCTLFSLAEVVCNDAVTWFLVQLQFRLLGYLCGYCRDYLVTCEVTAMISWILVQLLLR